MRHLILVPGLLCDARLWAPQVEALSQAGIDTRVSDATFHADSIDAMAAALLDAAPPRFALAGLSMGGYLAMSVMRQAPERVSHLALLNTTARADQPQQTEFRHKLIELAQSDRFAEAVDSLVPLFLGDTSAGRQPGLRARVRDMALSVGADTFVRQQRAIIGRHDARPGLCQPHCPTLVICGQQDRLTPPELAQEITACVPDAHLRLLSDCGHLSTLEQPEQVSRALQALLER